MDFEQWKGFEKGEWKRQIDVRNFIQKNYTPYEGDASFLVGITEKTKKERINYALGRENCRRTY